MIREIFSWMPQKIAEGYATGFLKGMFEGLFKGIHRENF